MSLGNLIPELWTAKLMSSLDKSLVYGNVVNRDYEGEISKYGDTVHIGQLGDITTFDYTKNTDMPDAEILTAVTQTLLIDQAKGFRFYLDSIDDAQTNPKVMSKAMEKAAYAIADDIDQFIASLYVNVPAENIVGMGSDGSPVVPAATDIYDYFVQADQLLNEQNVSTAGRKAIVPPFVYSLLKKSGEFTSATDMGNSVIVNGVVGRVAGFDISLSNNVPNTAGTLYKIMFLTEAAISVANQLTEVKGYEPEGRFGDAMKGLSLFGGKLVEPRALVVGTFNRS